MKAWSKIMKVLFFSTIIGCCLVYWACTPHSETKILSPSSNKISSAPVPKFTPTQEVVSATLSPTEMKIKEYGIYSALLRELVYGGHLGVTPEDLLLINADTLSMSNTNIPKANETLNQTILDDFQSKNLQPSTLRRNFDVYFEYLLLTNKDISSANSRELKSKYPKSKGILTLSRIGFDRAMSQALVYIEFDKGKNEVERSYWLLHLDGNKVAEIEKLAF
jgi:hypothetical protein